VYTADEDGNINPYATYPFNRPAGSPPGGATSQTATQRRSLATDDRRPARLETVSMSLEIHVSNQNEDNEDFTNALLQSDL